MLAEKGKYAESIIHFDKCLEIFPYFAEAWFNKACSHKYLLDVGGALKAFQKVTEYGDEEEGFVKTAQRVIEGMAASIFRDTGLSIDLYLQSADTFNQAFSFMKNKEYENAIPMFQRVIELNNNHAQSFGNLGLCYAFLGKKFEALTAFDRALEIDPYYQPAIDNRMILLSLNDGEKIPDNNSVIIEYYREVIQAEGDEN